VQNDLTKMDSLSLASMGLPDRQFFFRPGSTDEWVIEQVFRHHQYAFDQWASTAEILALVARRAAQGKKPLIIDAGANIGAVTVYFALKMPSARIVAIEPAADNFAVLERNTAGLDAELRSVLPAASGPSTWVSVPGATVPSVRSIGQARCRCCLSTSSTPRTPARLPAHREGRHRGRREGPVRAGDRVGVKSGSCHLRGAA